MIIELDDDTMADGITVEFRIDVLLRVVEYEASSDA